jgi:hypothetical protein
MRADNNINLKTKQFLIFFKEKLISHFYYPIKLVGFTGFVD